MLCCKRPQSVPVGAVVVVVGPSIGKFFHELQRLESRVALVHGVPTPAHSAPSSPASRVGKASALAASGLVAVLPITDSARELDAAFQLHKGRHPVLSVLLHDSPHACPGDEALSGRSPSALHKHCLVRAACGNTQFADQGIAEDRQAGGLSYVLLLPGCPPGWGGDCG